MPIENKGWFAGLFGGSKSRRIADEDGEGTSASQSKSPPGAAPAIGVLFGTHNWDSCAHILQELKRNGLAVDDAARRIPGTPERPEHPIKVEQETVERVTIGQLYGILSEALTCLNDVFL